MQNGYKITLSIRDENNWICNSVDLDEVAHNEPPHSDLHCLPSSLGIPNTNNLEQEDHSGPVSLPWDTIANYMGMAAILTFKS